MIELKVFLNNKLIRKTTLSGKRITIGRSENNDVVLSHRLISRLHAVIEAQNGHYTIQDHSINGTHLDKKRVKRVQPMSPQCEIETYPFTLKCKTFLDDSTLPLIQFEKLEESAEPIPSSEESVLENLHFGLLIGDDPSMHHVYQTIQRVGNSPVSVLITGESGTGKELVAKAIHSVSTRRNSPFVALDCAAIPETLIESELFGYEKGAFTGATSSKKGWFEEAQGGTVFLDEIGELSLPAQAKLLRFLQDKTYTRLGGNRLMQADVRVVTATNRNLGEAIKANQFRSDLYYRLRVIEINLPPLRKRKADLLKLAEHILSRIAAENNLSEKPVLTTGALLKLQAYYWPGNIRQLENVLYNGFIATEPPHLIDKDHLEIEINLEGLDPQAREYSSPKTFNEINKEFLLETLKNCNWDTAEAAKILKVSRGTIYYKAKKFGFNIKALSQ